MRRIRYAVATSLDGYIAGPKGEAIASHDADFDRVPGLLRYEPT